MTPMKTNRMILVLTALVSAVSLHAHEACACSAPVAAKAESSAGHERHGAHAGAEKDAPGRHPLRGVIVDVRADRSALLVRHEEIPGVMKAMTMLLKVDAETLSSAKKGAAITGLLVRKADGWWLEEVKAEETAH